MKKCMSGCGGKMMSKGGKVSPVKKMQKGGALKPLGAKIGVGTNIAGMIGMGVKAISDRVKAKKAEKKEKEAALDKKQKGGVTKGNWSFNKDGSLKTFESERAKQPKQGGLLNKDEKYDKIRKDIEKTTGKKSSLKYQKGGIAKQEIVGMPGYNAKTNTMKSGGSAKKTLTKAQAGRVVGNPKKIVDKIKRGPGVPPPTPMDVRKNPTDAIYDKLPDSAKTRPMTFSEREAINRSRKPIPSKINPGNKDIFKNAGPPPQPEGYKKGGATKAKKFAALAPPYNKPTAADRIAGAKKRKK